MKKEAMNLKESTRGRLSADATQEGLRQASELPGEGPPFFTASMGVLQERHCPRGFVSELLIATDVPSYVCLCYISGMV